MNERNTTRGLTALGLGAALLSGCTSYPWLPGTDVDGAMATSPLFFEAYNEQLISERTFLNGTVASTLTYRAGDVSRTALGIDFNDDGRIDPVVGYSQGPVPSGSVIQILLSDGVGRAVSFLSLTLDGNNSWVGLSDIAVGEISGDNAADIVAATAAGVLYLKNPGPGQTSILRAWGAQTPELEFLAGSTERLTTEEVELILAGLIPPGKNVQDYEVTVEQGYTNVEIADIDNDDRNDVVASRRLKIVLEPKEDGEPILLITGGLQLFLNPGNAVDGQNWEIAQLGKHERYVDLDREGASDVLAYDLDGDGDLDLVSAAREDDNVGVTWFENPGTARVREQTSWTPWRIGSVRDARAIALADFTNDGRVDVVVTGGAQRQLVLFEQPAGGPKREYDWDGFPVVTFENFEPRDVKVLDVDDDGRVEAVVSGESGQVRYFQPSGNPRGAWSGLRVIDFENGGEVGVLGYGDLDGDGDLDLIAVSSGAEDGSDRVSWIRNGN